MPNKTIKLKILTPNRTVLDEDVSFVRLRTKEGDMGVLHGHEPYSAVLDRGILYAFEEKRQIAEIAVTGGFVMIRSNEVVVLSSLAEKPEKLAEAIANLEKERTENLRNEHLADLEMHRVEKALRSTLIQTDISPHIVPEDNLS